MARQRWYGRTIRDARGTRPVTTWTPGPYPFGFAHVRGFSAVPRVATLEAAGWVRVGQVPGLVGVGVMRRGVASDS